MADELPAEQPDDTEAESSPGATNDPIKELHHTFKRPVEQFDPEGLFPIGGGMVMYQPRHERTVPVKLPESGYASCNVEDSMSDGETCRGLPEEAPDGYERRDGLVDAFNDAQKEAIEAPPSQEEPDPFEYRHDQGTRPSEEVWLENEKVIERICLESFDVALDKMAKINQGPIPVDVRLDAAVRLAATMAIAKLRQRGL